MLIEKNTSLQNAEPDRRNERQLPGRLLGHVVSCNGARATIAAKTAAADTRLAELWSVGRLISIAVGSGRVVALVYGMSAASRDWSENDPNTMHFEVELVGEITANAAGKSVFRAGISNYPYLGAVAHQIRTADLEAIYSLEKDNTAVIGTLSQDERTDATIHIPSMLSRHFAVVGTTGVGKSTAVALLLGKAIATCPNLRVLILDPHNEFASAFPDTSVVIDTDTLDLPFWLFRLDEFVEVLFRGRPPVPEEVDVLRDLIPDAKRAFRGAGESSLYRRSSDKSSITADTPVPYRMADLLALVDDRIGRLEGRSEKPHLRALKSRIMSAINDPRFHFMFSSNTINDTIMETIGRIFRIPSGGRPITAFQLSGIPSEVVDAVASVLCRMAFEIALWSNGAIQILVVCEEAHRYVPADRSLGFVPTRQAISRIAKEGRKYGISLGVVTQRPGELDPTILSQCSTVFAMRLANDEDQEIIRSAIADSSTSTTSFLSSIGNREAIAFGEAITVPMRMRFAQVAENKLPRTHKPEENTARALDLVSVVQKMRQLSAGEQMPGMPAPQAGDVYEAPARDAAPRETDAAPARTIPAAPAREAAPSMNGMAGAQARLEERQAAAQASSQAAGQAPALRRSLLRKPSGSLLK